MATACMLSTQHRRRRQPPAVVSIAVSTIATLLLFATYTSPAASVSFSTEAMAPVSATCARDRQLHAGAASCAPVCDAEGTAACVTYSAGADACVVANASSVSAGCPLLQAGDGCLFQCLPWVETTQRNAFTFYVTPTASRNTSDWSHGKLRQNDQFIDSIGAMAMPDRISNVTILGGASLDDHGMVDVRVALSLSGSNVTSLTLANLNMAADTSPSVRVLPSLATRLKSLSVLNSRLSTLPIEPSELKTLTTLDLSRNDLTSFPKEFSLESLQHLTLRNNELKTFEASFPMLQTLDLSGNQLDSIPANIFLWSHLTALDVSRNPLVNATFTTAQYGFLTALPSLVISNFQNDAVCGDAEKKLLKAAVVCVRDPLQEIDSNENAPPRTSTLSVVYIVVSIITVTVAVTLTVTIRYYRRQRRRAKLSLFLDSTTKTASSHDGPHSNRIGHFVTLEEDDVAMMKLPSSIATPTAAAASRSLWADEKLLACQLRFEDIDDLHQIGAGAFGVVWLVQYRETRLLASKRLVKGAVGDRKRTREFVAEIKLNAQLEHPAIVQFVGAAWTVESDLQALFEYMPNGDLRGYLDATRDDPSHNEWTLGKLQMAVDITEALVYVHSFTPALVHRDLKSKNVLLNDDMKAKLSDFGASRFQSENATMTAGVGTGRWLAPEVLAGEDYNEMCDIYSLGVVLSELDTHTLPYAELNQADVATLQAVLSRQARPRFNESCPPEIRSIADRCLAFDPAERPKAMEIAFLLRTFVKSVTTKND